MFGVAETEWHEGRAQDDDVRHGPLTSVTTSSPPIAVGGLPWHKEIQLQQSDESLHFERGVRSDRPVHTYAVVGASREQHAYATALLYLLLPSENSASSLVVCDISDRLASAEREFVRLTSGLNKELRRDVHERFFELLGALSEDDEARTISIASLRNAIRALRSIAPGAAPSFSVNDAGELYVQWYDGDDSVIGFTAKEDGTAIWSASQTDPYDHTLRTAEAGRRSIDSLAEIVAGLAPWVVKSRGTDGSRRRASG